MVTPTMTATSAVTPPRTPRISGALLFFLTTTPSSSSASSADFLPPRGLPLGEAPRSKLNAPNGDGEGGAGGAAAVAPTGAPTGIPAGMFCGVVTTGGMGRPDGGR